MPVEMLAAEFVKGCRAGSLSKQAVVIAAVFVSCITQQLQYGIIALLSSSCRNTDCSNANTNWITFTGSHNKTIAWTSTASQSVAFYNSDMNL